MHWAATSAVGALGGVPSDMRAPAASRQPPDAHLPPAGPAFVCIQGQPRKHQSPPRRACITSTTEFNA